MKCPICGTTLRTGSDRCHSCGYRTAARTYTAPTNQTPPAGNSAASRGRYYQPPKQKSSDFGCCCAIGLLIPIVLLLVVIVIGVVMNTVETVITPAPEPDYPTNGLYESLPAASEDCFLVVNGKLSFLPENWDGSPVMQIPESVQGMTVTAIDEDAFRDCDFLTTIVLPDTVTEIGDRAFSGCAKLRGLNVPAGVETIGKEAFAGCAAMEAITIPASVVSIASGCFDDCAALLFIFYDGPFEDWDSMYSDYITPFTSAICDDGYFYHGVEG